MKTVRVAESSSSPSCNLISRHKLPLDIYGTLKGLGPNFWSELVGTFGPLPDPILVI